MASLDVIRLLHDHNWSDTYPRLVRYAMAKLKGRYWQGVLNGNLPGGRQAEDLVMDMIQRVYEGTRNWDPEANPDLFTYLQSAIDSTVNHLAESCENRRVRSESALDAARRDDDSLGVIDKLPAQSVAPGSAMAEKTSEDFFWAFHEELADDPDLQAVVACIFDGSVTRAGIAQSLSIEPTEYDRRRKRLRRRYEDFRARYTSRLASTKGART